MTPTPRDVAEQWFEDWWNGRSHSVIDQVTTPDCVAEVAGGFLDRDGLREQRRVWLAAVEKLHVEVLGTDTVGTDVIVHWRVTGRHTGPDLGFPPSKGPIDFSGFTELTFEGPLITRGRDHWNRGEFVASLMQIRIKELEEHAGLTPREAQVALMVGERMTHVEIATDLRIDPDTALQHCAIVLAKLGVSSRAHVASALGKIPASVPTVAAAKVVESGGEAPASASPT